MYGSALLLLLSGSSGGVASFTGAATIAGAGAVAATGLASYTGSATIAGTGDVAVTGLASYTGAATIAGAGAIEATGQTGYLGSATIAGAGSVAATGLASYTGAATIAGAGSVSATGSTIDQLTGSATIAGAGSISATGLAEHFGSAVIAGIGSVDVNNTAAIGSIREAIFSLLSTSKELADLVGTRIYFGILPQSTSVVAYPSITYSVVDRDYGRNLSGSNGTSSAHIQIIASSSSRAISDEIAITIREVLDDFRSAVSNVRIMNSTCTSETDTRQAPINGTDQWIYQIVLDYLVMHRVSLPASVST